MVQPRLLHMPTMDISQGADLDQDSHQGSSSSSSLGGQLALQGSASAGMHSAEIVACGSRRLADVPTRRPADVSIAPAQHRLADAPSSIVREEPEPSSRGNVAHQLADVAPSSGALAPAPRIDEQETQLMPFAEPVEPLVTKASHVLGDFLEMQDSRTARKKADAKEATKATAKQKSAPKTATAKQKSAPKTAAKQKSAPKTKAAVKPTAKSRAADGPATKKPKHLWVGLEHWKSRNTFCARNGTCSKTFRYIPSDQASQGQAEKDALEWIEQTKE